MSLKILQKIKSDKVRFRFTHSTCECFEREICRGNNEKISNKTIDKTTFAIENEKKNETLMCHTYAYCF